MDSTLEFRLRCLTRDSIENQPISIPEFERSRIQRAIDYYADLVGTLVGIVILIIVMLAWVPIGPALKFDSNWWLLIGTYAGLVGLNDGFVLRNICNVLGKYEDAAFEELTYDDLAALSKIGIQPEGERIEARSFALRISMTMGDICSHELTVVLGVVTISD